MFGLLISKSLFLGALADGYRKTGDAKRALELLDEAVDWPNQTGERFFECELYRLKGEVLLMGNGRNGTAAVNCFRTAIELARSAEAPKLGNFVPQCRSRSCCAIEGHHDEARTLLAEIYNWFTEGFDTADLRDARPCSTN